MSHNQHNQARLSTQSACVQLNQLSSHLMSGFPVVSRRDLLRVSAVFAGAAALDARGTLASPKGRALAEALAQDAAMSENAEITIPFTPFGQAVTLDPHRTVNWGPFWVMLPNVWSGLLGFDENGGVVLDLAEAMDVSDDGSVYSLTLRENLTYANGREVLAEHFISSWRRALDPLNLSPMASFMEPVEGYAEFVRQESDEIGFRANDERTIEIRLQEPYSYFPSYLATFVWAVVDPEAIGEGEADFALLDSGAGAWRFTDFTENSQFVMEPNESYWDGVSPSLSKLTWVVLEGPKASEAALQLYRDDQAVSADIPLSLLPAVEEDDLLAEELVRLEQHSSTLAIGMDFAQPPFDDVRVRRALAASIDRDRWAAEIVNETFVPATGFTPPVIRTLAEYEPPDLIPFEPDTAKSLLTDAGFNAETPLPEIIYYLAAERVASEGEQVEALLASIEENSGIRIRLDTTKTEDQVQALYGDQGGRQFDLVWWWAATDTPSLLSYAGRTDSPAMSGVFNWSGDLATDGDFRPGEDAARFNEATRQADITADQAERNALYREAEELLLRNGVYIPLGHWVQSFVQKPWLQGTRQGPWSGRLPVRFDRNVVVVEH